MRKEPCYCKDIQLNIQHYSFYLSSCWLSVQRGVIWAFVAPMLAVILVSLLPYALLDSSCSTQINVVFLGLALRVLYKNRKEKIGSSEEKDSRKKLAK